MRVARNFVKQSRPTSSSSCRAKICDVKLADEVARRICITFQSNQTNAKHFPAHATCPATLNINSTRLVNKTFANQQITANLRLASSFILFARVSAHPPSSRFRQAWCRSGCFVCAAKRQSTLASKTAVMWRSVSRHLQ